MKRMWIGALILTLAGCSKEAEKEAEPVVPVQVSEVSRGPIERIVTGDEDALVKYLGHTKNCKSFRNLEYFRIKDGNFESLECYFGEQSNFPSAVNDQQN